MAWFELRGSAVSAAMVALALLATAGCGGQADEVFGAAQAAARVDNPFAGVSGYVNPEWRAHALAESGGDRVANTPTAIWLDRIGAVTGASRGTSLRQHLDNALAQAAGYIELVLYDLPSRNCLDLASDGELGPTELSRYQSEFVDPIAVVEGDSKYASLRIVNVIEPYALSYLVSNLAETTCATVAQSGADVKGIQYALGKLGAIRNVYNYVDISSHLRLGWTDNLRPGAALIAQTVLGAPGGASTVAGFVSNVAQYAATVEPYFQASTMVNGISVRQSKWVVWADYVDEQSFVIAMRSELIARGMSDTVGMLIDTSRNGWGGASRPTHASTSTNLDTFVDESRVDRRLYPENACNQSGAGLGERPKAVGANGIHAYAWIKPPGESDGSSNPHDAFADPMCDPNGAGLRNSGLTAQTGALAYAPAKGA